MDPVWSLLLLLRTSMGHGYTIIQPVYLGIWTDGPCVVITTSVEALDGSWVYYYTGCILGRAPRTNETLPDFL